MCIRVCVCVCVRERDSHRKTSDQPAAQVCGRKKLVESFGEKRFSRKVLLSFVCLVTKTLSFKNLV